MKLIDRILLLMICIFLGILAVKSLQIIPAQASREVIEVKIVGVKDYWEIPVRIAEVSSFLEIPVDLVKVGGVRCGLGDIK